MGYICDQHIWGPNGTCVRPGCRTHRRSDSDAGRSHPSVTSAERRAQVVALLPDHSDRAIIAKLGSSARVVSRIRKEELRAMLAREAEEAERVADLEEAGLREPPPMYRARVR